MQKNNFKITKEWIVKAQNDLQAAKILYEEGGPTDSICFHCHQAVEKTLKGFLVFKKGRFPKFHDLIRLLNLCQEIDKKFSDLKDGVLFLNRYYIETRYPPEVMVYSREECKKALKYASGLFQFIINKTGI